MLLLVLIVIGIVIYLKQGRVEEIRITPNDLYGTYSRGDDGEGEYGDGDIVEVVDNNDYYA